VSRRLHALLIACLSCIACAPSAEPAPQPAPEPTPAPTPEPPAAPAAPPSEASLLHGELPEGPQLTVMQSRCQICHTLEYVTQQRLSDAQWDKTLTKMQKWGSPLTDGERASLVPYLAATWRKELPERASPRVATPPGAVEVAH